MSATPSSQVPANPGCDAAVCIGRFQPLHLGHLGLFQQALATAARCIVVIGSAHQARSPKNPFTWQERADMISQALPAAGRGRLLYLPMRDFYDQTRWAAEVRRAVAELLAGSGAVASQPVKPGAAASPVPTSAVAAQPVQPGSAANPVPTSAVAAQPMQVGGVAAQPMPAGAETPLCVALIGHLKDASSSYLRAFPDWSLTLAPRNLEVDATPLRDAFFGCQPDQLEATLAAMASQIPASTLDWLRDWAALPHFAAIAEEWRMLKTYRQMWATAPYPPTFVTADAVVRCAGQVLLVRRGQAPGKGLYALPGGFIEQRETVYHSALRELREETQIKLSDAALGEAYKTSAVFDHPDRSQRGRTVTHAQFFDLGDGQLPSIQAGDDAAAAEWMPIDRLGAIEERLFDDHFHILDHFLGLLPR